MSKVVCVTALVLALFAGTRSATAMTSDSGGMEVDCNFSSEELKINVVPYLGPPPQCGRRSDPPVVWTGTGAVVQSSSDTLVIDQCSPTASCTPQLTTITVIGDKLTLSVPVGAYVKVSYGVTPGWGCTRRILIENIATWNGAPNPISASNRIYLAGAEGELKTFDSVPFVVDRKALGCSTERGCGLIKPDTYALIAAGTEIGMGQTKTITTTGRRFSIHNLRSYQTGACDLYWDWAFWIVED